MAIEDRGSRVASHAGRAHFVDPEPGLRAEPAFSIGVVGAYVLAAGRLEHLGRRGGHVLAHRELVLAPGAMDAEHGDPELVGLFGQLDVVVGTGQALTEPGHAHGPAARVVQLAFELHAEPGLPGAARPVLAARAALIAEPAHVVAAARRLIAQVAEPRHVDAVGAVPLVVVVQQALDRPARTSAEVMVHQIVPEHPTRVGEAVREAGRLDRKSTRLNSSHDQISYAVFCLKKKNRTNTNISTL